MYLYLDESGDLGFDFVNKKPTRHFVIAIMTLQTEAERKAIRTGVKRTLRNKLNPKRKRARIVQELKGTSTTLDVKKYFYRQVQDVPFSLYSIALNKRRVFDTLAEDKSRVYNWIARLLFDQIDFSRAEGVMLVVDQCKGKKEIQDFNAYIQRQLEARIEPRIPLRIRHEDSRKDCCLSAIDLFAWGFLRNYERRDSGWLDVFREKVRWETVYLPEKK